MIGQGRFGRPEGGRGSVVGTKEDKKKKGKEEEKTIDWGV